MSVSYACAVNRKRSAMLAERRRRLGGVLMSDHDRNGEISAACLSPAIPMDNYLDNIYLIAPIGWYTRCYSVFLPKGV